MLEFPPAVLAAMAGVLFGIPLLYLIAGWLLTGGGASAGRPEMIRRDH
jgi:hypothetical protein